MYIYLYQCAERVRNVEQKAYMKPAEAAAALNVGIATLRRWEAQGRIAVFRSAGGVRMYPSEEIERIRGLTSEDFKQVTVTMEDDGFGEEPTTLANMFQKMQAAEQAAKEQQAISAIITAGMGFPPHGGGFPTMTKERD